MPYRRSVCAIPAKKSRIRVSPVYFRGLRNGYEGAGVIFRGFYETIPGNERRIKYQSEIAIMSPYYPEMYSQFQKPVPTVPYAASEREMPGEKNPYAAL